MEFSFHVIKIQNQIVFLATYSNRNQNRPNGMELDNVDGFSFLFVVDKLINDYTCSVIQLLLGKVGLVSGNQMLSIWGYMVVGETIATAIVAPSTNPLTCFLLEMMMM